MRWMLTVAENAVLAENTQSEVREAEMDSMKHQQAHQAELISELEAKDQQLQALEAKLKDFTELMQLRFEAAESARLLDQSVQEMQQAKLAQADAKEAEFEELQVTHSL